MVKALKVQALVGIPLTKTLSAWFLSTVTNTVGLFDIKSWKINTEVKLKLSKNSSKVEVQGVNVAEERVGHHQNE
jgi:hypothetical protein